MKAPLATAVLLAFALASDAMLASSPASAEKVCTTPSSASAHADDMYAAQERCWKNLDTKGKALFGQSYMGMDAFTPTFPPSSLYKWQCQCEAMLCQDAVRKQTPKLDPRAPFPRSALPAQKLAPPSGAVPSGSGPCPTGKHFTSGHCCPNGTSWNPALQHCH
jgi:hypothetical protein